MMSEAYSAAQAGHAASTSPSLSLNLGLGKSQTQNLSPATLSFFAEARACEDQAAYGSQDDSARIKETSALTPKC